MSEGGAVAEPDYTKIIVDRGIVQRNELRMRNAGTSAKSENRQIDKPIKVDGKELLVDGGFGFIAKSTEALFKGGYTKADYSPIVDLKDMSDEMKDSVLVGVDEATGEVTDKTVIKTFNDIASVKSQILDLGITEEQFEAKLNEAYANIGLAIPEKRPEKRKGWSFSLKR